MYHFFLKVFISSSELTSSLVSKYIIMWQENVLKTNVHQAVLYLQTICESHNVDRVVFLTSVAGIYDKPPDICPGK